MTSNTYFRRPTEVTYLRGVPHLMVSRSFSPLAVHVLRNTNSATSAQRSSVLISAPAGKTRHPSRAELGRDPAQDCVSLHPSPLRFPSLLSGIGTMASFSNSFWKLGQAYVGNTVFTRKSAAALVKFFVIRVRRLFEGGAF